ncbi:TonB-dependent receptor [Stenotrophomonas sp. MMGLT7]|uniref:TonB-dependent siderophore receptor n=1 Tax=Stenotrophomonas sp. MMGLT7 TaxID=2901227 RepID=UPI001E4B8860|nr:TonB-dependent receptor [Stenotrophomonas sp. MMGLT7]MCD7098227.1 TonB-dependent receptor [Stenotrophomonas sp. MMGLT7]
MAAAVAAGALAVAVVPAASAQQGQPGQGQGETHEFDIPAGPLSSALLRFGQQSGLQFNVDSRLTDGKSTGGVHGRHSAQSGLAGLLAGSGLTFRFAGPRTVVIEAAPDVGDARVLGPLRIEGAAGGAAVNGVNGSSDVTATEGTGSYTSGALGVASKMPLSIKDTPQSVSVVTRQQIEDQNLTDFAALMSASTGISTITGSRGALESEFYSRGFRIQRLQLDGGAPLDIQNSNWGLVPQFDTALYDHVEILRGADGQYNAYGNPGGVINLTRKRPLDHYQVIFEAQVGSWNNYRTTLDATGPLGFDGRLRGRGVLVWQDQDFFYDVASSEKEIAYGVLEYDLTPSTVVGVGASRTWQDAVPFTSGLPRYITGAALDVSRSTSLAFPWNRYDFDITEVFGWVEHSFNEAWSVKLNATRTDQERDLTVSTVSGAVNPVTLAGPYLYQSKEEQASKQTTADLTLNGSFELFGHRQLLTIGGNYALADGGGHTYYSSPSTSYPPVDIFDFDPSDPAYALGDAAVPYQTYPEYLRRQTNAYANLRLTLWEPLHVNLGLRYSTYKTKNLRQTLCSYDACIAATGETVGKGELTGSYPAGWDTYDFSWPPTVSIVYDFNDAWSAYASYSDVYLEQSNYFGRDGRMVDPITGSNFEAGVKWAGRGGQINASLALYRIEQKNWAYLDGSYSNPDDYYQVDSNHYCCYTTDTDIQRISRGIDAEVSGEILPGWQISASYTLNENEENGTLSYSQGLPLQSRLPKHLFKLWSSYQFQGGAWLSRLSLGGGVNAQSRGYYTGTACLAFNQISGVCSGGYAGYEFSQGSYAVVSARAAWRIDHRWQVALNVNNLLDRSYWQTVANTYSGNYYGEPRSYTLSLRGQF